MSKFIPGVVVGAVLAGSTVFLLTSNEGPSVVPDATGHADTATNQRWAETPIYSGRVPSLEPDFPDEARTSDEALVQVGRDRDAGIEPERIPLQLSPEFDALLDTFNGRQMVDHIEQEPLDLEWSPVVESQLTNFYMQRPDVLKYAVPAVHCRSKTCQIQLVSYVDSDFDTGDWLNLLSSGLSEQDWASFRGYGIVDVEKDGVTAVVYHLVDKTRE